MRIGVVGIGRGSVLRAAADRPDVEFAAACDLKLDSEPARATFRDAWAAAGIRFEALYADFARFLEHDLDVVYVATPPASHVAHSVAVLESGRDAICEVPAAMRIE